MTFHFCYIACLDTYIQTPADVQKFICDKNITKNLLTSRCISAHVYLVAMICIHVKYVYVIYVTLIIGYLYVMCAHHVNDIEYGTSLLWISGSKHADMYNYVTKQNWSKHVHMHYYYVTKL